MSIKNISVNFYGNTLELSGEMGFNDVFHLLNFCISKTSNLNSLNIDLKKLSSSNSSVLIFIIAYIRNAKENNQSIKFLNVPDLLIELSKVYNLKKIVDKEKECI